MEQERAVKVIEISFETGKFSLKMQKSSKLSSKLCNRPVRRVLKTS